eukprot:Pgem_evm1s19462
MLFSKTASVIGAVVIGNALASNGINESKCEASDNLIQQLKERVVNNTNLTSLYNVNFDHCDLSNANLSEMEFSNVTFSQSNLTNVHMVKTIFNNCNFNHAKVEGVVMGERGKTHAFKSILDIVNGTQNVEAMMNVIEIAKIHDIDMVPDLNKLLLAVVVSAMEIKKLTLPEIQAIVAEAQTKYKETQLSKRSRREMGPMGKGITDMMANQGFQFGATVVLAVAISALISVAFPAIAGSLLTTLPAEGVAYVGWGLTYVQNLLRFMQSLSSSGSFGYLFSVPFLTVAETIKTFALAVPGLLAQGFTFANFGNMATSLASTFAFGNGVQAITGAKLAEATGTIAAAGLYATGFAASLIPAFSFVGAVIGSYAELGVTGIGYISNALVQTVCRHTNFCNRVNEANTKCPYGQKFEINLDKKWTEVPDSDDFINYVTSTQGMFGRVWYRCGKKEGSFSTHFAHDTANVLVKKSKDNVDFKFSLNALEKHSFCSFSPKFKIYDGTYVRVKKNTPESFIMRSEGKAGLLHWKCHMFQMIPDSMRTYYPNQILNVTVNVDNNGYMDWNIKKLPENYL